MLTFNPNNRPMFFNLEVNWNQIAGVKSSFKDDFSENKLNALESENEKLK